MSIFNFFKSREDRAKEYNNIVHFPEPIKLAPVPDPQPEEHYRVGFTSDNQTTLTLMVPGGMSTTLTMDRVTCEQLIKMLRATYINEDDE
jgi:hypothetical protein